MRVVWYQSFPVSPLLSFSSFFCNWRKIAVVPNAGFLNVCVWWEEGIYSPISICNKYKGFSIELGNKSEYKFPKDLFYWVSRCRILYKTYLNVDLPFFRTKLEKLIKAVFALLSESISKKLKILP